ncbi:hypothetical protein BH09MYX1_BH09MYX1_13500 [soil metagenome]
MSRCGSFFGFLIGFVLSGVGRARLAQGAREQHLVVTDQRELQLVETSVRGLPAIIDCSDVDVTRHGSTCPPLVAEVLKALVEWRPRARLDTEREYHDKFRLLLMRKLPEVRLETERRISSSVERGRVDIVLGDTGAGGLLIEMKAHVSGTELDRLVGQAQKYMRIWGRRGPLLLVLCRTRRQDIPRVELAVGGLRAVGLPVVAILAAPH